MVKPLMVEPAVRYSYLFDSGLEIEIKVSLFITTSFSATGDMSCPYGCQEQSPRIHGACRCGLARLQFHDTEGLYGCFWGPDQVAGVMSIFKPTLPTRPAGFL